MTARQYRIDRVAATLFERGIRVVDFPFFHNVRNTERELFGAKVTDDRSEHADRLFRRAVASKLQELYREQASASVQATLNQQEG